MFANYLSKPNQSEYSFADLQRDKETIWDGVHNPSPTKPSQMTPARGSSFTKPVTTKSAVCTAAVLSLDSLTPESRR